MVEALLVGDSVLNGLAQSYSNAGRAALAARHSFLLESAGCRRLITTSCRIPPSPTPTNALQVIRADAGRYDRALVIAAGYDDPADGPYGIGSAVDVLVAEARAQGIAHVIWLTYREAGPEASRSHRSNVVLHAKLAQYPELTLADWAGRSAGMPSGWFSADGIHLGVQAAAAMGVLIGDALDALPTVPSRCTAPTIGTPRPADPPSAGASATGGVHLLAAPQRLVDTRSQPGPLGANSVLAVPVSGIAGVPGDATAAFVSVIAVEPCADTYLTVFPCGSGVPTTSVVNATAHSVAANSALVRLGQGAICVYSPQPTDVVVDVSGWLAPGGDLTIPVDPVRLIDTRVGMAELAAVPQARLQAGSFLDADLTAVPGLGSAIGQTDAVTVNVTATGPGADGFVTVLPGPCRGQGTPTTSTVNFTRGIDVATSATVGLTSGHLCLFASAATDLVVDLQSLHGAGGATLTALDPQRLLDSRAQVRLSAGQVLPVGLGAAAGVTGPVSGAVVDITAINPVAPGFVALHPCNGPAPTASSVNFAAGATVANRAVVSTGGTDRFCITASVDTDVVIDLEGVISSPP
ncbi:MAG: hypothetical protein JWL72_4042 [Ilumatobacteraceae bacterium]|nr:hypothetical protein [Ilumatobacteraceae bacterium]MCU1390704.1 hypothetical protein [Ilumatobacteraceae bacterium]